MQWRHVVVAVCVISMSVLGCGTEADTDLGGLDQAPTNSVSQDIGWKLTDGHYMVPLRQGTFAQIDLDGHRMTLSTRDVQWVTDLVLESQPDGVSVIGGRRVEIMDDHGRDLDDGKGVARIFFETDASMDLDTVYTVSTSAGSEYWVGPVTFETHYRVPMLSIRSRPVTPMVPCRDLGHCP